MPIHYGDRIYIYIDDGRDYILTVQEGKQFSTHRGNIMHDEIAGKNYGENVLTTKGNKVYLLPVGIIENIYHMRRCSQIVYPKDLGFILLMLDIREGNRVIDVGLGSGSMSAAMARLVGNTGMVYAYERREDMISLATQNLIVWKLIDRVTIQQRDIEVGFDEKEIDAIFLDVPQPWDYLKQCWDALAGGGRLGIVSPTAGQVMEVLRSLNKLPFIIIEVWENMFRQYKPDPYTFRPYDRMVAHTTYMIFARKVNDI
ncbi:tRNA (adenine-N1)-methyltransferase [Atribacter laminatus]|uniref:tRNA (adenine(58)-N(1))-methyltransferase TrmI n=1 Tax=Atribacter laminatus TaxID=2847778 RepID=A0A7T1F295_ATRLM|nr:tRNA (adenine-N1)-methyltransferase [Atribacter laminatus]QPM67793.1 tRNA (adenine(58)-N(1))-methyltransferase TrmI [Atribacter laminatus]